MADFDVASVEELRDRGLRSLNRDFPALRTGPGTPARLEVAAFARMAADNHPALEVVDANATPLEATSAGLLRWGTVLGVPRKLATGARKAQSVEATGTPASVILAGAVLVHQDGLRYAVQNTAAIPAGGAVLLDIEAIDTGPNTRRSAGDALKFSSPPTGVNQTARVLLDFDEGGEPDESIGAYRERLLTRFRQGGQGGNRSDYEQWVLASTSAIRDAFIYGGKPGLGWVSVAGLRDGQGASRVLNDTEREEIRAYLLARKPVSDKIRVLVTPARTVHVELAIGTLSQTHRFDWDDAAGFEVSAWDPATRVLTWDPAVPSDLSAGKLLAINSLDPSSSGSDGWPAVVAAVTGATTTVLTPYRGRAQPFSFTPAASDIIHASSTTAWRVREAVVNGYIVGCGSDEFHVPGINQLGPANPEHAYGPWASDITISMLLAAARSQPGVASVAVVTPAADELATEYEFPDDDQVELLVPGQVLVRSL
jgi:uncharacterized phage protein gp47/JayE